MLSIINKLFNQRKESSACDTYYPDDVFLVSYPKSGNTWLRFLIANYISGNKCDFLNSHLIIPDIHYNISDCKKMKRPRILKSHCLFTPNYSKVVYLVRDGRDVAVSYFYHQKKYYNINDSITFQGFLKKFNLGEGVDFGKWGEHALSWLENKVDDILIVRYEDLRANPEYYFSKILGFCSIEIDDDKVKSAISKSSLRNMKKIEIEQFNKTDLLSKSDKSIPFVRQGTCGEWRTLFNDQMISEFQKVHGKALMKAGYADR